MGLRTLILVIICFSFVVLDQHSIEFQKIRSKLDIIVLPIQMVVDAPIRVLGWVKVNFVTKHQLLDENTKLRVEELFLKAKLQKLITLEQENEQLRQLLQSASKVPGKMAVAQLLAVDLDPALHQMVVDKGQADQVYVGQPVIDAYGITGQIVEVGPLTSRVLMLTDSRFAIPVQDSKNGIRAIAIGLGTNQLMLVNVMDTHSIKVGDLFVASALGLRFPEGYPVGIVSAMKQDPTQQFTTIYLTPSAHTDNSRQVLLVWTRNERLYHHAQLQIKNKALTAE